MVIFNELGMNDIAAHVHFVEGSVKSGYRHSAVNLPSWCCLWFDLKRDGNSAARFLSGHHW